MYDSSDSELEDEEAYGFFNRISRKRRVFRQRENFIETLDEQAFLRRFRINKNAFRLLLVKIEGEISPSTNR